MKSRKIPDTDSIDELARFWDTHDLTEFEDQLEEVTGPVFERRTLVKVHLQLKEIEVVEEMARAKGVDSEELIKEWILEKIRKP